MYEKLHLKNHDCKNVRIDHINLHVDHIWDNIQSIRQIYIIVQ